MYDAPSPEQLLAAVARFLRDEAGPALAGGGDAALAYHARVAANMLDIAQRQARLGAAAEAAELLRLRRLLVGLPSPDPAGPDHSGEAPDSLAALNRRLAQAIASGAMAADHPGLAEHLWCCTLDKLAVDQPGYASYRRLALPPG